MNNPSPIHWLQLTGLCPLIAIGLMIDDALLLSATLSITLIFTSACILLLRRWIIETQRLIATAFIAAISVGAIDLLLQAFCYERAQTLQIYLPLNIIVALLFSALDIGNELTLPRALFSALFATLLRGAAFAIALLIVAVVRAPLPNEAGIAISLISSGLLFALATKITSYNGETNLPSPNPAPRTRARVTGPVR